MTEPRNKVYSVTLPPWASMIVDALAEKGHTNPSNVIRSFLSRFIEGFVLQPDFNTEDLTTVLKQFGSGKGRKSRQRAAVEEELERATRGWLAGKNVSLPPAKKVTLSKRAGATALDKRFLKGEKLTTLLLHSLLTCEDFPEFKELIEQALPKGIAPVEDLGPGPEETPGIEEDEPPTKKKDKRDKKDKKDKKSKKDKRKKERGEKKSKEEEDPEAENDGPEWD